MKHILFLVGSYYPDYSAVGFCIKNIAEEFQHDYKVSIVSLKTNNEQTDSEKYLNQRIYRISTKYYSLRFKTEKNIEMYSGIVQYYYRCILILLKVIGILRSTFSKSIIDKTMYRDYSTALYKLDTEVDVIIPACSPMESVLAALDYNKKENIAIFPILFDLFSDNNQLNRYKFNKFIKRNNNRLIELRMLKESKSVFFVNNWKNYLDNNFNEFNEKLVQIEHPLFIKRESICINSDSLTDKITITYAGLLDRKNRNPQFALDVLEKLDSDLEVKFYTFGSGKKVLDKSIQEKKLNIKSLNKVASSEIQKILVKSTYLIVIGNRDTSQLPSKIFEYMSIGKPLIYFAQSIDDPALNIIENYPIKYIIIKGQENNFIELNNFIRENANKTISIDNLFEKYYYATPEFVSKQLMQKIGEYLYE